MVFQASEKKPRSRRKSYSQTPSPALSSANLERLSVSASACSACLRRSMPIAWTVKPMRRPPTTSNEGNASTQVAVPFLRM
jgi:hypothetical protein